MSVKPRTIDNIGVDASSRYARDQAELNANFIEDSRFIPQKAATSVLKPYVTTDFEQYLAPNKQVLWAEFAPPPNYFSSEKLLFTYQLIPSIGSPEKQEADLAKLAAIEDTLNKKKGKNKADAEVEKAELKTIRTLLQTIHTIDRMLNDINARRNQYQRG